MNSVKEKALPDNSDEQIMQARNLVKTYSAASRKVEVLKGIDLTFARGTTTALVGASGAGKSTLLHLLGGLDRPTDGEVIFEGENIFAKSDDELASFRNRSIGFVFQFHHLLPEFTALENVMMPLLVAGTAQKKAKDICETFLSDVGLSHRMLHRPGELSGGEQQRVAIARALSLSPKMLLADEPTGNLDMKTSEDIHRLLDDLQKKNRLTLAIVTHNETLASAMGRTIRLADGRITD